MNNWLNRINTLICKKKKLLDGCHLLIEEYVWGKKHVMFRNCVDKPANLLKKVYEKVRLRSEIVWMNNNTIIDLGLQWHQSQFFPAHFHLLLLPVSTGVEYSSALFPVDCSLPANSSCREAAIAFILFFHIDNSEVAPPIINQFNI